MPNRGNEGEMSFLHWPLTPPLWYAPKGVPVGGNDSALEYFPDPASLERSPAHRAWEDHHEEH